MNCTKNGKCSNCGQCCIPWLPITWEEYLIIKDYIKDNKILPTPCREGDNIYMDCPFHDRHNKKCNIYEVRPEVCRAFSCGNSNKTINKNRKYYDDRAFFNGKHVDRFIPLDLLFYDKPDITLYYVYNFLQSSGKLNEANFKMMLNKLSEGFPKDVPFATTRELCEHIEMEWSD